MGVGCMHAKEDSLSDSEITAKLLEFMLRNRKELKFVFEELEKYRMLKARGGGVGVQRSEALRTGARKAVCVSP